MPIWSVTSETPSFPSRPSPNCYRRTSPRNARNLIDPNHANCDVGPGSPLPAGGDTIYLSVVDRDGNMVSLIQSNYEDFGSGMVADGTGFALQIAARSFNLDRNSPNALAPRKRPAAHDHSGLPGEGDVRIAFGIMGGWNQSQAHAQFVSHVADFNQNIQAAMEAPRFTKT